MQTQGITFGLPSTPAHTSRASAKTENAGFERIMSHNVSEGTQRKETPVRKETVKECRNSDKEANTSNDTSNYRNMSLSEKDTAGLSDLEEPDIEKVEDQVVLLLQKTFGLSEEEVVDILEQLGMTPMDLVLMMTTDLTQIMPVHADNIKALVMEIHGTKDANAFLVSDTMCRELSDVLSGVQDILSQELGIDMEHFGKGDEDLIRNFAMKWEAQMETQNDMQDEASVDDESSTFSGVSVTSPESAVIVETMEEFGSDTKDGDGVMETASDITMPETGAGEDSSLQVFAERLNESYESLSETGVNGAQPAMNHIVEQVVHHVRIRVLPQTTSMELQLNPESLGRVNLTVTSQNGTSTATLTVQNEVAKEALESQITVLKENLESHGLKVESVEVTVSEFGFKNQENSNNDAYQRKKPNRRRFRLDNSETVVEATTMETQEERQDGTSVVDYTA